MTQTAVIEFGIIIIIITVVITGMSTLTLLAGPLRLNVTGTTNTV